MRRLMTGSVLGILALLLLGTPASASPIAIGWLTYTDTGNGGIFSVVDQTGVNYLNDPAFPVVTQVTFDSSSMNLAVDNGSTTANLKQVDGSSPDGGMSWDIPFVGTPLVATLTSTVSPLSILVDLDGGGPGAAALYNVLSGIMDSVGNPFVRLGVDRAAPLADGDFAVIYVDAVPAAAPVPEPATLTLFGTGIASLVAARRRRAASKA